MFRYYRKVHLKCLQTPPPNEVCKPPAVLTGLSLVKFPELQHDMYKTFALKIVQEVPPVSPPMVVNVKQCSVREILSYINRGARKSLGTRAIEYIAQTCKIFYTHTIL
jgi:hypothetical protein